MKIFKKVLYVFALLIFLIFYLGPFIWTFIISITPDSMVLEKSLNFLPDNTTLKNYLLLFDISSRQGKLLFSGMRNAIYASFVTIVLCIPMALLSAYALSRFKFFGKDFIKNSLLITMAIPVMATIIPIYKMFMQLKLLNNMYALSLVYVTSYLPVIVWLMSNYFSSIPRDLDEAAMVDGCTKTEALIYVVHINDKTVSKAFRSKKFDSLIPMYPLEKLEIDKGNTLSNRIISLISPIGKGQRALIVSPPKAGKTTMLKEIAIKRSCLKKGNEYDYEKAAAILIQDFREGKLGKISLEKPKEVE